MVQNRTQRIAADQKLIAGVQQHLAQLASLTVAGQSMTPADIVKALQDRIGAGQSAIAADAARTAAVQADQDEQSKTATFVSSFRKMIQGMYAKTPGILADFGMKPPTVTPPSAATKAAAVAKSKATRAARHTMGSKQKQAVHGTVDPAPAPPAPASPAPTKV